MREILFRGKRAKNKEWIYGSVLVERDYPGTVIVTKENHNVVTKADVYYFDVIPETVGQYTGLTDKKGARIFEGDILKMSFGKDTLYATVNFGEYNQPDKILRSHLGFYFDFVNTDNCESFRKDVGYWTGRTFLEIEVIGNIHDNPELLGVKK